jgi:hypothetical protein
VFDGQERELVAKRFSPKADSGQQIRGRGFDEPTNVAEAA